MMKHMNEKIEKEQKPRKNQVKESWYNLKHYYNQKLDFMLNIIRKNSNQLKKNKLVALITIDIHLRDLIDFLMVNCNSISQFNWLKQIKFNKVDLTNDSFNLQIEHCFGFFEYGFEYQGNNGRLVITPLTVRVYLTLTTALHLKKGANLQGPAGTGKTESVKDLGKMLGRMVFVFNCSESLDVQSIKNMFEGLAQTGFWGCFDEFNRIEIEVLSVIAVQIKQILDAISIKKLLFEYEDKEIPLNINCAIFITMNPGYQGRTELPNNIKTLFKPISLIVPDYVQICKITLYSQGFKNADILAKKIEMFYTLISQQLSFQNHYDFGLRAIKSVLTYAGIEYRKNINQIELSKEQEQQLEQQILIESIIKMNQSKLIKKDQDQFNGVLFDLFPNEIQEKEEEQDFQMVLDEVIDMNNFDKTKYFSNKVQQLYDTKITRHGVIIIGESMSGKSTLINILQQTMNLLKQRSYPYSNVKLYQLNPKALTIDQLFGYNLIGEDMILGVFSSLMRDLCNHVEQNMQKWIIFDGPIDTKWIESINSLLDDNKILTLVDGNRINLHPQVSLVFEVSNLEYASPATVSRCGIIYLDEKELEISSIRHNYILKLEENGVSNQALDFIEDLFEKWIDPVVGQIDILKCQINLNLKSVMQSFCRLLDCYFTQEQLQGFQDKNKELFMIKYERIFIFCVVQTFGVYIAENNKKQFDTLIRDIEGVFPIAFTVYDYYYNNEKSEFALWEDKILIQPSNWKPPRLNYSNLFFVETRESIKQRHLLNILINQKTNIICFGESSTSKTSLIQSVFSHLDETIFSNCQLNLLTTIKAEKFQNMFESKMNRSTKKKLRPFNGKHQYVLIEDLHFPKKDDFQEQPTLELLKQMIQYQGFYDLKKLDTFINIMDINYIMTLTVSNQELTHTNPRLINKLHLVNFSTPSNSQIKRIFHSILNYKFSDFNPDEIKPKIEGVVVMILNIYKAIINNNQFKPTPEKFYYQFNVRDISKIINGIAIIDKFNCDTLKTFLNVTIHECQRVLLDRFNNEEDKSKLNEIILEMMENQFQVTLDDINKNEFPIFCKFLDNTNSYTQVSKLDQVEQVLQTQIEKMNKVKRDNVSMVLFRQAIMTALQISRIINIYNSHGILFGEGGQGRRSLAKIVAFIQDFSLFQLETGKKFNYVYFKNQIKAQLEEIVIQDKKSIYLIQENQLQNNQILDDIYSLISIGEIPNLFQKKDGKDEFGNIKDFIIKTFNVEQSEIIQEIFINQIQKNIHMIFCIQKTGNFLKQLTRKYPGFLNCTTQIWIEEWSQNSLYNLGEFFIQKAQLNSFLQPSQLAVLLGDIHQHIFIISQEQKQKRDIYITPIKYIDLMRNIVSFTQHKIKFNQSQIMKYKNGLDKLEEAQKKVDELKNFMDTIRFEVSKKKKDCENMMIKITYESKEIEKEKQKIQDKEQVISVDRDQTIQLSNEAQKELVKAIPILEEASKNVQNIDSQKIAEIKAFFKTKDVRLMIILNALMVLLDKTPDPETIQKEIADPNFVKKIKEINKDEIKERKIIRLEKYTQMDEVQGDLKTFSITVHLLFEYIKAIETYAKINRDVEPKRRKVQKLQEDLKSKEGELKELMNNLQITLDQLERLNNQNEQLTDQYIETKKEFNEIEERLDRAEKLVYGLISSKEVWESKLKFYNEQMNYIDSDSILTNVFLTYMGPFKLNQEKMSKTILLYLDY